MPRRKASAGPVSTQSPEAAPAKRRGRKSSKNELTRNPCELDGASVISLKETAKPKRSRKSAAAKIGEGLSEGLSIVKGEAKSAKIRKVSKVAKAAALNAEPAPVISELAPKKKRGAQPGNQNAKGNKGVPGNQHAKGKSTGRPPAFLLTPEILNDIKRLSAVACTQREAASFLDMTEDAFEGILRTYARAREAWDRGGDKFNVSLRRKNAEVAMAGNVQMLKFLSMNRLGMVDKVDHGSDPERPVRSEMTFKVEFVKNAIGADQHSIAGGF